ncbi:hypothetical protein [Adhaeretor mobilis]|uniref:Uncharacterized protein n=1 Tax=Adhaeretor mobilis TaxID=1930276 RepID=A0A517MSZ4_9BACT|nr:hypothetical protein [Adhaeretor mobilis]QDS98004.1 hypothetical protein HG15A2_12740 [Adhaeretor mobilis]
MSVKNTERYRNNSSSHQGQGEWWKLLAAVGLTVAIVYFGHMRPADRNLLLLQRQCHELNLAVSQLTRQTVAADGTLGVIESLSVQNARIADAEAKLNAISQRWDAIASKAEAIATRTGDFAELAQAQSRLATHSQTLDGVLDAVDDLEILRRDMKASHQQLTRAGATLANLEALQSRLTRALDRVDRAAPALDAVDSLCEEVALSRSKLAASEQTLAEASGKSFKQVAVLASQLERQSHVLAEAHAGAADSQRGLDALVDLKDQVLTEATDLTEAEATLQRLVDMQTSVQLADETLNDIQHMVVDVMLIQPAAERAVAALKPVVEFTRMSQRLNPQDRFSSKPEAAEPAEKVTADEQADSAAEQLDIATTILNWF